MNDFNGVINALWTVLEADETWAGLMTKGTKYKFASGELLRKLEYESAWCPIFAIAPEASGSRIAPARRRRGKDLWEIFSIRVEGATAGQDRAPCLALLAAFHAALSTEMESGSTLIALGVDEIEFDGLAFDPTPNANMVIETWKFSLTAGVKFREG